MFSGWIYDQTSIRGIRLFYVLLALSTWLILPVAGPLTLTLFIVTLLWREGKGACRDGRANAN